MHSKADMGQLNLPHGTNEQVKSEDKKTKSKKKRYAQKYQ